MLGRLIERLFVEVRADMSDLSKDLSQGVTKTKQATTQMATSWNQVSTQIGQLTKSLNQGTITQGQYTAQMNRLSSAMKGLAGSYQAAQKQVWGFAAASQAAQRGIVPAMNPAPLKNFGRSAGQARMQIQNLGFQINDIGQTLATGMNPLTVLIQQGSQILQIYSGQGGVKAAFSDLAGIFTKIARHPAVAAIAAMALGMRALQDEINKTSKVTVSFMDTVKAVFQTLGDYIWPLIEGPVKGIAKAFQWVGSLIAEYFPKVMNVVIQAAVIAAKAIGATWDLLPMLWADAWSAIKNVGLDAIEYLINLVTQTLVPPILKGVDKIIGGFLFAYDSIRIVWSNLPGILSQAIAGAVNWVVSGTEKMVNAAIEGVNKLIAGLQYLINFVGADKALELFGFSGEIGKLDPVSLNGWKMESENTVKDVASQLGKAAADSFNGEFTQKMAIEPTDLSGMKNASSQAWGELGRRVSESYEETTDMDYMGKFFKDIKADAIANAQKRLNEELDKTEGSGGRAAKGLGKAKKEIEMIDEVLKEMEEALSQVLDDLSSAFTDTLLWGESLREGLAEVFRGIATDLMTSGIRELMGEIFGIKGEGLGGLGNFIASIMGIPISSKMVKAPGRATGGTARAGNPYWKDELGPELFVPAVDGRVLNAADSARVAVAASRGGAPQVTIQNFNGSQVRASAISRDEILVMIEDAAPGIVTRSVSATRKSMSKSKSGWGIS